MNSPAAGLYPVFQPAFVSPIFPPRGCTATLGSLELLEEIAESLGVIPLSHYCDLRELPAEFDGNRAAALALLGPRDDWHTVDDGVQTLALLLAFIDHDDSAVHDTPSRFAALLPHTRNELQRLHAQLLEAGEHGCRLFRLDAAD